MKVNSHKIGKKANKCDFNDSQTLATIKKTLEYKALNSSCDKEFNGIQFL